LPEAGGESVRRGKGKQEDEKRKDYSLEAHESPTLRLTSKSYAMREP
jgi:hypothetical protein